MQMPTQDRRFFIALHKGWKEEAKEQLENQVSNSKSTGKGVKSTKITGDAVKKYSGKSNS